MPPLPRAIILALQHVIVMISTPIASVFLISGALQLDGDVTRSVLCVTLLACGIGSILQSMGWLKLGAKLPFVMLPGGAAVAIFIQIATEHSASVATGSVIIAAAVCLVLSPLAGVIVKVIPPVVLAVMITVIGVNVVKIAGGLISKDEKAPLWAIGLAAATVGSIIVLQIVLPRRFRSVAILLGMAVGTVLAVVSGHFESVSTDDVLRLPTWLPYGSVTFDLVAAVPLIVFSIGSMAEATGQTTLNADIVGKKIDKGATLAATVRGDALTSLIAAPFGGQTMLTSGENIGIVRATGVTSRFVTALAGVFLILIALIGPVADLIQSIPAPVIGGTAVYAFTMIVVSGLRMFQGIDMTDDANFLTATAGFAAGLLPILTPSLYLNLPADLRLLLGNGVTMSAIVGMVVAGLILLWKKTTR
ncbi:uracil-xanthine permease family protein [Corynebacterium nuruki]|uniref:uracil-xanthine permease family protein n=1 Tax=Corynebacterium nuruki TaxID=1032851 RepID=UPI0039BFB7C9